MIQHSTVQLSRYVQRTAHKTAGQLFFLLLKKTADILSSRYEIMITACGSVWKSRSVVLPTEKPD
jgi:hypothetical protein